MRAVSGSVTRGAVYGDDFAAEVGGVFGDSPLRRDVDVDEAEAAFVGFGPFEGVED